MTRINMRSIEHVQYAFDEDSLDRPVQCLEMELVLLNSDSKC